MHSRRLTPPDHRVSIVGAALIAVAVTTAAPAAWACSTCATGDPTLTTMGAEQPFENRVRLATMVQHRSGQDGLDTLDEQRLDLAVSWAPTDRWIVSLQMPFVRRTRTQPNLHEDMAYGPGDLELRTRYLVYTDRGFAPRHQIGVQAGADLPTTAAVPMDFEMQPGRGAFSPTAGLTYGGSFDEMSVYLSSNVLWPVVSRFDTILGPSWLNSLVVQYQPWTFLAAQVGADTRWSAEGTSFSQPDASGAGFVSFAVLGVSVSPVTDLLLNATVRLPVYQALSDDHSEGPVFSAGLTYDL